MNVQILLIAFFLIILASLALGIKYYNNKKGPICLKHLNESNNSIKVNIDGCQICGGLPENYCEKEDDKKS